MTDSATQPTSSHSVAELAAELQKLKRAKVWWWQRDDILKARMSTTVIAGIFLSIVLTLYLGLLLTNRLTVREIHIVVLMLVLLVALFFAHSAIRLFVSAIRPPYASSRSGSPSELDIESQAATTVNVTFIRGPGGYAIPDAPIPISFPDIDKAPTTVTSLPPPIYGQWRSSVRVNPDQFFWIRRDSDGSPIDPTPEEMEARTPPPPASPVPGLPSLPAAYRPPSYSSEDGVEYVLGGPRLAGTAVLAGSNPARESQAHPEELDSGYHGIIGLARGSVDGARPLERQSTSVSREQSPSSLRRLA